MGACNSLSAWHISKSLIVFWSAIAGASRFSAGDCAGSQAHLHAGGGIPAAVRPLAACLTRWAAPPTGSTGILFICRQIGSRSQDCQSVAACLKCLYKQHRGGPCAAVPLPATCDASAHLREAEMRLLHADVRWRMDMSSQEVSAERQIQVLHMTTGQSPSMLLCCRCYCLAH